MHKVMAPSSPTLQRLRAGVAVLSQKLNPTQRDVHSLFSAWGVHRYELQENRPLAAVIAELHKRYDAGIKTVRATGPRMLNDVVEAWLNVSSESTHTAMPKVAVRTPPVASAMANTRS